MAVGRSRLARVIGPILIFLGALLITTAIAGPTYVAGKLKTIPLDIDVTTVATAQKTADSKADADFPARSLDLCSVEKPKAVVNDVAVTAQTRTLVTTPSDKSSMTMQSGMSMVVPSVKTAAGVTHPPLSPAGQTKYPCNDGLVLAWLDRVSLDRTSAAPTDKTSEATFNPGESSAVAVPIEDRQGLQYRFPAGTTKDGDYKFFDLVTRSNIPLKFVEEKEVSGTNTLHFRGSQDWVDLALIGVGPKQGPAFGTQLQMSADWWGMDGGSRTEMVTLNRFAQTAVDLWVDPKTGIIIDQGLHYQQKFRLPEKASANATKAERDFKLDVFDANLRWSQATVRSQAETATSAQDKLALATRVAPIAGGLLGVIALALGGFAVFLGRGAGSAATARAARRAPLDDAPTLIKGGEAATAAVGTDAATSVLGNEAPTAALDGDPATEAFSAQPRPDEARTEAIDFRRPDQR